MTPTWLRTGVGLAVGIGIAAIDSLPEVSPVIVAGLLLVTAFALASLWGGRGLPSALLAWACLPALHLGKHVFGLADTIYPNTYTSIGKLALFSFLVAAVGARAGLGLHRRRNPTPK